MRDAGPDGGDPPQARDGRGPLRSRAAVRPVLYLDLDDTIVTYADGTPRAAPGARDFILWALETFQVRWLTRWCPDGRMSGRLLADLCEMLLLPRSALRGVRGFDWRAGRSKLNGIAWVEHVVLERRFLWIEDEYGVGPFERAFLARHGFGTSYRHCNVTRDPAALAAIHVRLRDAFSD